MTKDELLARFNVYECADFECKKITVSDEPTSSKQQHQVTELGRSLLENHQ